MGRTPDNKRRWLIAILIVLGITALLTAVFYPLLRFAPNGHMVVRGIAIGLLVVTIASFLWTEFVHKGADTPTSPRYSRFALLVTIILAAIALFLQ